MPGESRAADMLLLVVVALTSQASSSLQGSPFPGSTLAWSFLPHAGLETKTAFHISITYTLVLIAFGTWTFAEPEDKLTQL